MSLHDMCLQLLEVFVMQTRAQRDMLFPPGMALLFWHSQFSHDSGRVDPCARKIS